MIWSAVSFGKCEGKTLPEIIVRDLEWFFWAVPKLYGKLGDQAQEPARKARTIKIPNPRRKNLEVEYQYELGHRFCGFAFVDADNAQYSRWATRLPYLDLSWPLRRKYDKRAGKNAVDLKLWEMKPNDKGIQVAHFIGEVTLRPGLNTRLTRNSAAVGQPECGGPSQCGKVGWGFSLPRCF